MPRYHTRETVERALELLHKSADENGGTPNLSACSRALGLSRKALRLWWANRPPGGGPIGTGRPSESDRPAVVEVPPVEAPALHVLTTAKSDRSVAPDSTNPAHLYALDEVAFIESQAHEAARLYNEAKRDRSYVAAGKMFDRMTELYVTLRNARQTAADAAGLDESAFIERLEDEVRTIPDPHLEVYVREYLDRHRLQLVDAAAGG